MNFGVWILKSKSTWGHTVPKFILLLLDQMKSLFISGSPFNGNQNYFVDKGWLDWIILDILILDHYVSGLTLLLTLFIIEQTGFRKYQWLFSCPHKYQPVIGIQEDLYNRVLYVWLISLILHTSKNFYHRGLKLDCYPIFVKHVKHTCPIGNFEPVNVVLKAIGFLNGLYKLIGYCFTRYIPEWTSGVQ